MRRLLTTLCVLILGFQIPVDSVWSASPPNVLVCISDDQSYPHASAYGAAVIETPGFDEVARRGMLFNNAFTPAPGCSPMRAAFLTGRYIWQIGAAGTHASHFPRELVTFPEVLDRAGYHTGFTGKGWGPGKFNVSGWQQNPAGLSFSERKGPAPSGISKTDYFGNFVEFLDARSEDQPFCFWFGGHEPHRVFGKGLGAQSGMNPSDVSVPGFLPDTDEVRSDLLDYFFEIQWFDQHLVRMLRELERRGELDNTLVIVTSDNGMSFPRAKANLYEYGIHMPLAICGPRVEAAQVSDALVNLIDVSATIYDVCEQPIPESVTGRTLKPLLVGKDDVARSAVYSGRERHSSSRWNSLGYPCRCVRTEEFLYIRNYTPERWPAGAPQKYSTVQYGATGQVVESELDRADGSYHDIDACPTLDVMIEGKTNAAIARLLDLAVSRRPAEELYRIADDAACLENLADVAEFREVLAKHRKLLSDELTRTGDLRETDFGRSHIWESYPRYSSLRWFPEPDWVEQAESTPPTQAWLEDRRPR